MDHFTPVSSLVGGALIGASASLLLAGDGRIAGISGIVRGLLRPAAGEVAWRALFVLGLLVGGLGLHLVAPERIGAPPIGSPLAIAASGLVVGFGTALGSGCTSGHGVCGLSRGSRRSLAATIAFMASGALTAFLVKHVLSGGIR